MYKTKALRKSTGNILRIFFHFCFMVLDIFFLSAQTGKEVLLDFFLPVRFFPQVPSLWTETVKDSCCVSRTRPGLTASWAGSSSAPQVSKKMGFAIKGP